MKREIKFRGKSTDTGKWIYGFLSFFYTAGRDENGLIFTDKAKIYSPENCRCDDVWAETVGQFTGVKYNDREIYEHIGFRQRMDFYRNKRRSGSTYEKYLMDTGRIYDDSVCQGRP